MTLFFFAERRKYKHIIYAFLLSDTEKPWWRRAAVKTKSSLHVRLNLERKVEIREKDKQFRVCVCVYVVYYLRSGKIKSLCYMHRSDPFSFETEVVLLLSLAQLCNCT